MTITATKSPETVHDERLLELSRLLSSARSRAEWEADRVRLAERRGVEPSTALLDARDKAVKAYAEAVEALTEHERAYAGWARFWLVVSSDGHVHSTTSCHTCYVSTEFGLLPHLSGLTEADAVGAEGEILCSVCFPTAPVAWTIGERKGVAEARAEREAKRLEREAKRLEKALLPSGEPLEFSTDGRWPESLATLAAAKSWLTDAYAWNLDHPSYPAEAVALVADAVAAKTGESVEAVLAAAAKRAERRR